MGAFGLMELGAIAMMSVFSWGSGIIGVMGLPPAGTDAALARTAPKDSLIYVEWAERGPGKEGGKGIEGLAGDPEVKRFVKDVWKAIETAIAKETEGAGPDEKIAGKHVPALVKILLDRPGCISIAMDDKALMELGKGEGGPPAMRWLGMVGAVRVAVVFNGGKQADAIAGHISELVQLLPAEMRKKDLNRIPIPIPDGPPGLSLTLHRHKTYFILGFGQGTIDNVVAGLDGKSKGLTGNETYTATMKKIAFGQTANLMWINGKGAIDKVAGVMGKQVLGIVKMLGLDTVDVMATSTGVVDGEMRTRNYLGTGGKTDGVLALFSGRGIKPADLKHVPADSDLLFAFSMNAKNVLNAARKIVAAADPGSSKNLEDIIKKFEEELGLRLEADLFAALGDVWVIHDSKSAGGVYVTSLVASAEVRDHKKASEVFNKLMDVLEEALPGPIREGGFRRRGVYLKSQDFMGQKIQYVNFVGEAIPFAPAFCLTKTHLLIAPHPQALKAHLRFLASDDANFGSRLGKDLPMPEGDLLGISFCESKPLVRAIYAFAPYLGSMAASMIQSEGGEIDIFSLPSARAILPYVGDSFSTTVRTKDGILSEGHSSIPLPAAAASVFVMPFMWLGAVRADFAPGAAAGDAPAIKVMQNSPRNRAVKTLHRVQPILRLLAARKTTTAG